MSELINQVIDLSNINSKKDLHLTFKNHLSFPEFYGENWDALWDAINGLVEMPNVLTLNGWNNFENRFPEDSKILKEIIEDYNNIDSKFQIQTC